MSGELPATYYIHHICKILIYHIWEKSVLHVETKSNIKIVSWKCSVSHTTSYRTVTYPWELLKHSRKNSLRESKVPRVLWLLASTKSDRFWTNREAYLQSLGCSFSWFLEIADVWKTLWAGRLKLNTGLWSTGISLLQEKLLRKFTKWESWPIFRAFCSKIMHELWSIFLRTPSLVKNFPIVSWGIWLVEAWWETPHARKKCHVGTTKLTDCKLHKYFHTYLSYFHFCIYVQSYLFQVVRQFYIEKDKDSLPRSQSISWLCCRGSDAILPRIAILVLLRTINTKQLANR